MENDIRFVLQPSNSGEGRWLLTDTENWVHIEFEEHKFNDTQKVTLPDFEGVPAQEVANRVARIMREMGDYMASRHYLIAMPEPENVRLRMALEIKCAMNQKGVSIRDLSELTGYNISNLSRILNGKYSVGIDVLHNILTALDKRLAVEDNR